MKNLYILFVLIGFCFSSFSQKKIITSTRKPIIMAKDKKQPNLVQCIYCKHATILPSGEIICTTKYKGEEITDYSRVDENTKLECVWYKEK